MQQVRSDNQPNQEEQVLILDESGDFKVISRLELSKLNKSDIQVAAANSNLPIDTGMEAPMLQPPPPMIRKNTPSFYFSPEDEEEVAKFKSGQDPEPKKKYSLDKIVLKVIENFKLKLDQPEQKSKLRFIVFSFLRDRRSLVDTKAILSKDQPSGGLALATEMAEKLAVFLKEIKAKIDQQAGVVVDEKLESNKPAGSPKSNLTQPLRPKTEVKLRSAGLGTSSADLSAMKEKLEQQTHDAEKEVQPGSVRTLPQVAGLRKVNDSSVSALPKMQRLPKQDKGKIKDIKKDYKLVGPVDELAILNLETFRRLASSTKERAKKVLQKINLLAEDSLAKKAAGIKAWRQSPLYKMYVAVGQISLEQNLNVNYVIQDFADKGKEVLTLEEFEAISDLNKLLRF